MVTSNSEQDDLMGLLIAVSREDRLAFQRLYEKISGRMFGLCLKLASQRDLAEEAVQDATSVATNTTLPESSRRSTRLRKKPLWMDDYET